jgi:hypothetical protein
MEQVTFTLYDVIQIVLMLLACFACKAYGYQKGISDTVGFFEDQGIIEITDDDEIRKSKDQ